ncbi:DUF2249 domain-containing protein [Corynebacterium pygosceleis]|uniref:DUF2249 domain-containing protein n=1 Tax=Corynebacterium pygosceleis TaxID=2800406 RepID=A0A9Q4C818_9CORY|nr:DUF2249 domain-containing protein [Corynebacterium pygosceleis]MCK7637928.1 DUF2249 domain-containing protein [Corynebacterium pygosceleis]MCK7675643.1 DUF2249 domain-containing protein [Corynebacterium pygosceleis]MCL0120963.1 DUF2249 domain-containing protein [Corynebacterium pygosceleis]MCX7444533.1 DUF2249 domain-containing protein [Corynebacterium pygosceleis]MCX7468644.1 DUF2249 domain-containing protein [Corynebacterium pygosceleis]
MHPREELPLTEKTGSCGCGDGDVPVPELDAAAIPHAIRHGAIHGALGTLAVGGALILVAPHNPVPLLNEIAAREESFDMRFLRQGPDEWRIRFTRVS